MLPCADFFFSLFCPPTLFLIKWFLSEQQPAFLWLCSVFCYSLLLHVCSFHLVCFAFMIAAGQSHSHTTSHTTVLLHLFSCLLHSTVKALILFNRQGTISYSHIHIHSNTSTVSVFFHGSALFGSLCREADVFSVINDVCSCSDVFIFCTELLLCFIRSVVHQFARFIQIDAVYCITFSVYHTTFTIEDCRVSATGTDFPAPVYGLVIISHPG